MALNKAQFLEAAKEIPSYLDADVPGFGTVRIRILTTVQRTKEITDWIGDNEARAELRDAVWVAACILDPDTGERMFSYQDVEYLAGLPGLLNQLFPAVLLANKLLDQDTVTFEKKSDA